MFNNIGQDVRYAIRGLLKDRGSVALALLALALGIGATTVVFSVVYSVLIAGFPFENPSTVVHFYVHAANQASPLGRNWFTAPEFLDYRAQNHSFSTVMGGGSMEVLYTLDNSTYRVRGAILDPHALPGLGIKPILGRTVTDSDGAAGAPPTFLMSDRMWHERFNRNPGILGMTLTLNGVPRTLIAVLPPRFVIENADVFFPTAVTADMTEAVVGGPANQPLFVWTFARLKPGVSLSQAAADINVIAHNEAKLHPELYPKQFNITLATFADAYLSKSLKKMVYILLGAVLMLLLIACSNVANLLLARATAREKELAVRATLGASRARLVRQLLMESFLLAAIGTMIGCFLAYAGMQWVKTAIPANAVPAETEIRFSTEALIGTAAVTILTTILCGLLPALRAARSDLQNRLMGTGKGVGGSSRHGALRGVLVAVQVSLAMVLLIGAGLMMRTFFALQQINLGIDPKNILMGRVVFPRNQYATADAQNLFYQQTLQRIGVIPGVVASSPSLGTPVEGTASSRIDVPGIAHSDTWTCDIDFVGEGYFQTVGLPLVRGKLFSAADVDSKRRVAVINRTFAQEYFAGEDPIGRTIQIQLNPSPDIAHGPVFEVAGIVADARNEGMESAIKPEAFVPYTVTGVPEGTILIRTSMDPLSVLHNVQQQIWNVDRNVAFTGADSLEKVLHDDYTASPEFGFALLGIFAGIGLILSAIGVFSVMAYTVSLQTHDIGIRMALGAQRGGVMKMVLLKGLRPIFVGVAVGWLASYGLTRLMASQIYGVTATDPWTFSGVAMVLVAVGSIACLLPARRATQVDPLIALRYE